MHRRSPNFYVLELNGVAVGLVELSRLAIQPTIADINSADTE